MKIGGLVLISLLVAASLATAQSKNKKVAPLVVRHWQHSFVCNDPGCNRAALWTQPEGSILLKWFEKDGILIVSIREAPLEQELRLTPSGTHSQYRELTIKTCTECLPLKSGERAQLYTWSPTSTIPPTALVAKAWVQAALEALPTDEKQARSLITKGGKP